MTSQTRKDATDATVEAVATTGREGLRSSSKRKARDEVHGWTWGKWESSDELQATMALVLQRRAVEMKDATDATVEEVATTGREGLRSSSKRKAVAAALEDRINTPLFRAGPPKPKEQSFKSSTKPSYIPLNHPFIIPKPNPQPETPKA